MGYQATTIFLFGVPLTQVQAELINQKYLNAEGEIMIPPGTTPTIYFRKLNDYFLRKTPQPEPVTPYVAHAEGCGSTVFNPQLISDGTDSRCDSLIFDPNYNHYLGIYIGSKGYGYQDNLGALGNAVPAEVIENFVQILAPICVELVIDEAPQLHVVNQTW